jgi:hypothetical protein
MVGMEWLLEIALMALLALTLFHAARLERALGVLKRDRAALEALVADFNGSTQAAEQSIVHLKTAADGAGRQIARHVESAVRLKDDLAFLSDRGERVADRLERAVREARNLDRSPEPQAPSSGADPYDRAVFPAAAEEPPPEPAGSARPRSRAEQDLIRALRLVR